MTTAEKEGRPNQYLTQTFRDRRRRRRRRRGRRTAHSTRPTIEGRP